MAGDAKWDSEELALLASFTSEERSSVRELSSGSAAVQLLKLMPTKRGQVRGASCRGTVNGISQPWAQRAERPLHTLRLFLPLVMV